MFDLPKTFGRYRLVEFLGKGAMAEVYRATLAGPLGFLKSVAVKIVPLGGARDEALVSAMANEARLGARLDHPNLVHIVDFNRLEGCFYLAMEYVDGIDVDDILAWHRRRRRFLPAQAAIEIARQACRGLTHAHGLLDADGKAVHLVHRDLKPGNLRVSADGVVKVLDFGIARSADRLGAATTMGVTKGTPLYMSPEQVSGGSLTPASDVFSLGAVLYEMITLKQLFAGENLAHILNQILKADTSSRAQELEQRAPGLGAVLSRATARRPADRYQRAADLELDLGRVLTRLQPDSAFDLRALVQEVKPAGAAAHAGEGEDTRFMEGQSHTGWRSGRFGVLRPWRSLPRAVVRVSALLLLLAGLVLALGRWRPGGDASGRADPPAGEGQGPAPVATGPGPGVQPLPVAGEPVAGPGAGAVPAAGGGTGEPSSGPPVAGAPGASGAVPEQALPKPVPAAAPQRSGKLVLDADSAFYARIDGQAAVEGPLDVMLPPGPHELELRPVKYPEARRTEVVQIPEGGELRRFVQFKPAE